MQFQILFQEESSMVAAGNREIDFVNATVEENPKNSSTSEKENEANSLNLSEDTIEQESDDEGLEISTTTTEQ